MADAVASVDPAALADVIRRCEAAVASWHALGDIETRACLGKSADFPTAIRDAAPLVLAVERQLRDEGASRGDDAAALDDENLRVASRSSPAEAHSDEEAHSVAKPVSKPEANAAAAAANARRGATVVELCGPERGHLLGMLVRALLPVEAVAEVVLVDRARPPQSGDADVAATPSRDSREKNEPYAFLVGGDKGSLTFHKANVKNGSHLRSLHEALRRVTAEESRRSLVFVARRLAGTATLRACQLFDASTPSFRVSGTEVTVPVSLLLEPGDAPPMEASLKSKLLFRVARAHACAARQLYPAKAKAKNASAPRRGRAEPFSLPKVASEPPRDVDADDASRVREGTSTRDCVSEKKRTVREKQRRGFVESRTERRRRVRAVFPTRRVRVTNDPRRVRGRTRRSRFRSGETRFALARRNADRMNVRENIQKSIKDDASRSCSREHDSRDAFGPVAWTVIEQMAQLNAAVARRLGETDGYVGPTAAAPEKPSKPSPSPNGGKVISRSYFAFASPPRLLAGRFEKNVAGFLLRRVAPSRWTLGGYADEHYVKPDPEPHGVCYEAVGVDANGVEILGASAVGLGFVSVTAHERGGTFRETRVVRDTHDDDDDDDDDDVIDPQFGRVLTNAQIERLCVKAGARGVGVAQTLLRVADGFHACGVPARVKTASEKARASFAKMTSLLRFVGFKDPTTAGVSKSRGVRTVVVVDDVGKGSEEKEKGKTDVDRADRADRAAAVPPRWGSDPGDARARTRGAGGEKRHSRTRRIGLGLRRPTSSTSPSARRRRR